MNQNETNSTKSKKLKSHTLNSFAVSMLMLALPLFFQNCSPANFSTASGNDPKSKVCLENPSAPGCPPPDPCILNPNGPTCPKPLASFSIVADNVQCAICHLQTHGSIGTTSLLPLGAVHPLSFGRIHGDVNSNHNVRSLRQNNTVSPVETEFFEASQSTPEDDWSKILIQHLNPDGAGGVARSNRVKLMSGGVINDNLNGTGQAIGFPLFKAAKLKAAAQSGMGYIDQATTPGGGVYSRVVNKYYEGNLLLDGSQKQIRINGEVYIKGNLIIKGKYWGKGTIYVEGSIFIPDDIVGYNTGGASAAGMTDYFHQLRAKIEAQDTAGAQSLTDGAIASDMAALRLAASEHVIIGFPGLPAAGQKLRFPAGTNLRNYAPSSLIDPAFANQGVSEAINAYPSTYSVDVLETVPTIAGVDTKGTTITTDDEFIYRTRYELHENYLQGTFDSVYADPAERAAYKALRQSVYSSFPVNYGTLLKPEYELSDIKVCEDYSPSAKAFRIEAGAVSRIDATVYGQKTIGGIVGGGGNLLLNGGVVTRYMNLLPTVRHSWGNVGEIYRNSNVYEAIKDCSKIISGVPAGTQWTLKAEGLNATNPVNGIPLSHGEITMDYRLQQGGPGFETMRSADY